MLELVRTGMKGKMKNEQYNTTQQPAAQMRVMYNELLVKNVELLCFFLFRLLVVRR